MLRDFSNNSRYEALKLIDEVENGRAQEFTNWTSNGWNQYSSWIGKLGIKGAINSVNAYHKKVINKNTNAKNKINNIYDNAIIIDQTTQKQIENLKLSLGQWVKYVDSLNKIITPSNGVFNSDFMSSTLGNILKNMPADESTFNNEANEKYIYNAILSMLSGLDKFANEKEAGFLKGILSYFGSFYVFFSGEKVGLEAVEHLYDLSSQSIKVWSVAYMYYREKFLKPETGFFGKDIAKQVSGLNILANVFSLCSSLIDANKNLNKKSAIEIFTDYVDCIPETISLGTAAYKFQHIDDEKALSNMREGLWSALDIYEALGEAGIKFYTQYLRSYEKYSADGVFDGMDIGEAGVDAVFAGIKGLAHRLSFGADDVIFTIVDIATGGDGKSELNFAEKAAEGYKIIARTIGDEIGGLINKFKIGKETAPTSLSSYAKENNIIVSHYEEIGSNHFSLITQVSTLLNNYIGKVINEYHIKDINLKSKVIHIDCNDVTAGWILNKING